MTIDKYGDTLKQYWGYEDFRGIQRNIIESIGQGKDTLGLMPTGGGKSITFQVPALTMDGVCVVITPLVALMKDQVANLRKRGIKATAIYSGLSHEDILTRLENCIFGGVKFLYVSPERLASQLFQVKLKHMKVCFITVDEAHCISQWGYDFRPSYLNIADIRKIIHDVPILALTATATPEVVDDIQERLGFEEKNVFRMSFERKNLAYVVRKVEDKNQELIHILSRVQGSAIVYVRSRQRTKETAEMLNSNGFSATYYNAGLESATKDERQKSWTKDEVRVMVATNAFGMGIDKPDVRTVIHIDCPDSIEAYFQEAGRAGRDGKKAYAVLLYNDNDYRKLDKRITDNFPEKEYIKKVYEHLAYYYQIAIGFGYNKTFEFNIDKFCHIFKYFPIQVEAALRILDKAGYIEYMEEQDNSARVMFTLERDELYRLKNNSPTEEKVVVALLRNYSGLFCDYNYIDESFIASQCGLTSHEVYDTLKQLNHKGVISFIPRKRIPFIKYTQRREEKEYIVINKDVYDNRKEQFCKRINAVKNFTMDYRCRSRQLLEYFGETSENDCNQCDVCLEKNKSFHSKDKIEDTRNKISALLADGKKHHVTELHNFHIPSETLNKVLHDMMTEEEIFQEDGYLFSPNR
jgi:ATP-dependent DNA helicase RecQ